jgi:hypothetical protein
VTDIPPPTDIDVAADDDTACLQTAKRLRIDHPRWVIVWVSETRQYHAYPLFRTRREVSVRAAGPADLVAQLNEIEQATPSPRPRSPDTS